jgi:Protein of unknown function (DUF3106)
MRISPSEANKVARLSMSAAARSLRAVFISGFALVFCTTIGAQPTDGTPSPAMPKVTPVKPHASQTIKPLWTELTPMQQQALAPLATEWDKLDSFRKNKWLAIGNKYASMKPDEQQRVQERMRDWVKLTPEQRRIARESYARAKKLDPDKKSEKWQQYQQLPEEQKKKLAADVASKKHVATLPPASQAKTKTVPPIKEAPKPVIQQSVTPQATNQSALQPAQPPVPQPVTK